MRETPNRSWVTSYGSLILGVVLACAGCAVHLDTMEGNYVTYDHDFTDAAAASVRERSARICAQREQVAVMTSRVCSLTRCTTSYQCMSKADARLYTGDEKR